MQMPGQVIHMKIRAPLIQFFERDLQNFAANSLLHISLFLLTFYVKTGTENPVPYFSLIQKSRLRQVNSRVSTVHKVLRLTQIL